VPRLSGAQTSRPRFVSWHPDATPDEVKAKAHRLIEVHGPAVARLACVYYMDARRALGIADDGWQVILIRKDGSAIRIDRVR
jgi:hypothetical protein